MEALLFFAGAGAALILTSNHETGKSDKKTYGENRPDAHGNIAANRKKVQRVPLKEFPPLLNDRLLKAAVGEPTDRTPVWMMRQAGRYLPEFRELRKKADFFNMCQEPELACQVSLQPLERFPTLDAVIVFSDILVIPQAMGMEVIMVAGKGPVFPNPLKLPTDLEKLVMKPELEKTLGYVFDVVNLVRQKVNGRVPVIGFSGAPFTLMGYMIEGGGSKTLSNAKRWLLNHPVESHRLLQALTDIIVEYTVRKVEAGAQLLQIFESNGGDLGPEQYYEFSYPYLAQIARRVKEELKKKKLPVVPMTVFARGVNFEGALEKLAATEFDAVSLDWCIDPTVARNRLKNTSIQGNLDPCTLYASPGRIRQEVGKMLNGFGTQNYIANLGHGMHPDHDPEHAHAFIKAVQELSLEMNQNKK